MVKCKEIPLTDRANRGRKKKGSSMLSVSVAVISKTDGKLINKCAAEVAIGNIQLNPDQMLSWRMHYYNLSEGYDWVMRIIRYRSASAHIIPNKGTATTIPNVEVMIEGDPADVMHLIEEVTKLLGGVVTQSDEPYFDRRDTWYWKTRSWFLNKLDKFATWVYELMHAL